MKKLAYIFLVVNIFTLSAVIYLLLDNKKEKSAYFLSAEVYNSFDYKIELEKSLENKKNKNKATLDSLEVNYQMLVSSIEGAEPTDDQIIILQRQQKTFFELQEKFENEYVETVQNSYTLIWDRINEYVQTYGKDNGYTYIFGANGDGSVMYADNSKNITPELIVYINNKYSGN